MTKRGTREKFHQPDQVYLVQLLKGLFVVHGLVDQAGAVLVRQIDHKTWFRLGEELAQRVLPRLPARKRGAPSRRQTIKARLERYRLFEEVKRRKARNAALSETQILRSIQANWTDVRGGALARRPGSSHKDKPVPLSTLRRELRLASKDTTIGNLATRLMHRPLAALLMGVPGQGLPHAARKDRD